MYMYMYIDTYKILIVTYKFCPLALAIENFRIIIVVTNTVNQI